MAFYNTDSFYNSYDSYYNSYNSYYDSSQIDPPIPQPSNEPTIYNLFDYPTPDFQPPNFNESPQLIEYKPVDQAAYSYPISYASNSCSASSYSATTVIEHTQFAISHSVSEFNEVEFEEYDPTPYGGGYDISETYGKPLQPSTQICYPKTGPVVAVPKRPIEEPSSKTKPTQIEKDEEKGSEIKETVSSLPDLGSGYGNYGRELSEFPSGCGLEAVDLCESLFGHWPCLSRAKRQTPCVRPGNGCGRCHYCYSSQWQGAADYLFGSHDPYPDGDAGYGYQRQFQGDPVRGYVWFNGFNQNV